MSKAQMDNIDTVAFSSHVLAVQLKHAQNTCNKRYNTVVVSSDRSLGVPEARVLAEQGRWYVLLRLSKAVLPSYPFLMFNLSLSLFFLL